MVPLDPNGTFHQSLVWARARVRTRVRARFRARLGLVGHPMRSQGIVREWDGMDKRDQVYSRPGTGGMSHGIPGHPTAKSDNPHNLPTVRI